MRLYLQQLALVLTLFAIVMAVIILTGLALVFGGLVSIEIFFPPITPTTYIEL